MNTREVANEYRLAHWVQVFRERIVGENVNVFCPRVGISLHQFYYWQKKIREAACHELALRQEQSKPEKLRVPQGWAVCEEVETAIEESRLTIEIGKFRLNVSHGASSEHLEKVCRILVSLC